MNKIKTGLLAGSLRKDSFCLKTAKAAAALLPNGFETFFLEIGSLPLYNEDLENEKNLPPEWLNFRRKVESLDAFLFVTPEYNRGMPAALKNALDVASRPKEDNKWKGKPGAIISVTVGKLGAFGAYHSLRQTLGFLDVPILNQPEMYISGAQDLFGKNGEFINEGTRLFFASFAKQFANWALRFVSIK
ncbi:MAG: NAD(P)H-dependent oxidoreductase [Spirochaetaceae bacterium]|jgi:chromate reductase|nr:NAD(P)H-dependent oxidoreductase [Spirochaetaceae bacterium]